MVVASKYKTFAAEAVVSAGKYQSVIAVLPETVSELSPIPAPPYPKTTRLEAEADPAVALAPKITQPPPLTISLPEFRPTAVLFDPVVRNVRELPIAVLLEPEVRAASAPILNCRFLDPF